MSFAAMSASELAAWWGAVVATLALLWNIIRAIRSGARVRVRASPNMSISPNDPATDGKLFISVTAVNKGNAPTTITTFCGYHYRNFWARLRRKGQGFFFNPTGSLGQSVPHVLGPGEQWSNMAAQEGMLEKFDSGAVFIGVIHNQRRRPVFARVAIKNLEPE